MRASVWLVVVVVVAAGCGGREPPAPTVVATVSCESQGLTLGSPTVPLDPMQATMDLQREVIARVTSVAFVREVATAAGIDEEALAGAVSAHPVKGSRLVEIGVALLDRALATRVCDALVGQLVAERRGGGVIVVDHCGPPAKERS